MVEKPKLGITQEIIDEVEARVTSTTDVEDIDDVVVFVRGVNRRMAKEQPELSDFLRSGGDRFKVTEVVTFAYGAALAYEMIPETLKTQPLTKDHIESTYQSMIEHIEVSPETALPGIDADWFLRDMEGDSPDYRCWLGDAVASLDERGAKSDFILGNICVVNPFYKREQAQVIEEKLW